MIRVGVGGWTFEPWRGSFFPPGVRRADELAHASRHLTSIEVNGTFYRTQKPDTFRKWADETPDNFMFALKGPRYVTNRALLAGAGPAVERFVESGITELGPKLGPILWQFAPTRAFVEDDLAAFLDVLPRTVDGQALRHVIEVRHESFRSRRFVDLLRRAGIPVVYADSAVYPAIADLTGDFVYARLQRCCLDEPDGYSSDALDTWASRFRTWSRGGEPADLPRIAEPVGAPSVKRACFVYFISGAKVRAPAAATALIARLQGGRTPRAA